MGGTATGVPPSRVSCTGVGGVMGGSCIGGGIGATMGGGIGGRAGSAPQPIVTTIAETRGTAVRGIFLGRFAMGRCSHVGAQAQRATSAQEHLDERGLADGRGDLRPARAHA